MTLDKKILSIDYDDIDDIDIQSFVKFNEENSNRSKNKFANEIFTIGDNFLSEIDEKNQKKYYIKEKQIKYILKHDKFERYTYNKLKSFSFEDVFEIYLEIRDSRNIFKKILHFIFNL